MQIPADPGHDVLVVIPTVADPAVLVQTVARILDDARAERLAGGLRVAVLLAVNPDDEARATQAVTSCEKMALDACVDLATWKAPRPIGFGAANNRGTMAAWLKWGGLSDLVVYHNDDAHVARGWLRRLLDALQSEVVHGYSEPWDQTTGDRQDRPRAAYGRIGLVGPLSNLVAGIQQVRSLTRAGRKVEFTGDVDLFAAEIGACRPHRLTCDFLSGFCVGIRREAIADLLLVRRCGEVGLQEFDDTGPEATDSGLWLSPVVPADGDAWQGERAMIVGPWDEDRYPIAGYEDNDLCVRAEIRGWRPVVATDCFVGHIGHQTFDRLFKGQLRGLRNRERYYDRWAGYCDPPRDLRLVAAIRLRLEVGHDLHLLRMCLQRLAQLVDGVAIVLTANPLDVRDDARWPQEEKILTDRDRDMLRACSGLDAAGVAVVLRDWIVDQVIPVHETRWGRDPEGVRPRVVVESWPGSFNERDERNRTHELAEGLGADWILSVDADEIVENRIERRHLDRYMRHPDPLVRSWDQSWVNHWDSERLARDDAPWGDDATWLGGMHGFRLWRVPRTEDGRLLPVAPRRIFGGTDNGLHCGNSPDHDVMAKRVSTMRFRHFGYVRAQDRVRKHARYRDQDPNPNPMLTGNSGKDPYGHILGEQFMRLSPFVPLNGIGMAVLVHAGEKPEDLCRLLNDVHGLCDRVVLVWTDPWDADLIEADLLPAPERVAAKVAEREQVRAARDAWVAANPDQAPPREPPRLRAARRPAAWRGDERVGRGPSVEWLGASARFGCEWVHQPLADDLGAARNAGLEALSSDSDSLGWSMFFDLDEHFDGGAFPHCVTIRRMAECSDAHAWLFQFLNVHDGQEPSRSESYRMARLLPGMRLRGRVHETYDAALEGYSAAGADPRTRRAPFTLVHVGLALDEEGMDGKLRRYHRLLLLELQDRPHNGAAWVSLGLHYLNEGRDAEGLECLERGVLCAGGGYLPYRELATYHLRRAGVLFHEAMSRSRGTQWYAANEAFAQALAQGVAPLPILGSARRGLRVLPEVELPSFEPPENPGGFGRR